MEKKNNNVIVIGVMAVIIIILAVLCVLFATNTLNLSANNSQPFNDLSSNNSQSSNDLNTNKNEDNIGVKKIDKVYFGYFTDGSSSYSTGLVLFSDNTFQRCDRYECLKGNYTLEGNHLNLVTTTNEEYPTSVTYKYNLSDDNNENKLISNNRDEYCDLKEMNSTEIDKVYFGYFNGDNSSYSTMLVLFKENKFEKCDRYECLNGNYTLEGNHLNLVTTANEEYPTSVTYEYNLSTNNDENTLISSNRDEYCDLKEIK